METPDLFFLFTRKLENLDIKYMVTGSVATILYGEPRLTNDIDIVVFLGEFNPDLFVEHFPLEDFYCPPQEVLLIESKRRRRGHFNLIHHETGFKADIYIAPDDSFFDWALQNANSLPMEAGTLVVAPPEYVLVSKLSYYKEGQSEKHLSDLRGMLRNSPQLDWGVVQSEVKKRGLEKELALLQSK